MMLSTIMAHAFYQRSPVVTVLKKLNLAAKRVLPRALYRPLYESGISTYRALIRGMYRRHVYFSSGDDRVRAQTVLRVMPYSLVGHSGLEATYDAVADVEKRGVQGSVVECGVAQGGCAGLMCLVVAKSGRPVFLFDSYEGLPDPTQEDYVNGKTGLHQRDLRRGECLGTVEQVSSLLFDTLKLDRTKITLIKGWFQNTLGPNADRVSPIAVLRIDADWYESVKCCLDALYDRVVSGGYIIIDDYGSCFGAKKAVDEFLEARKIAPQLKPDGRGGIVFQKALQDAKLP